MSTTAGGTRFSDLRTDLGNELALFFSNLISVGCI